MSFATETPLALNDAARLFGVHRRTIENWIKRGLESRRLGRLIYTSREAIDRFAVEPNSNQLPPARKGGMDGAEKRRLLRERHGI